MKVTINGVLNQIQVDHNSLSLDRLIKQLGHHPRLVVVEYNGTILTPEKWEEQQISDGDNLEIVTIVGGGS